MSTRRKPPKLCLHKSTGQAFVLVAGKPKYLGKFGTPKTQRAYAAFLQQLADREQGQAEPYVPPACDDLRICELLAAYWAHAQRYYVKHGEQTGTVGNVWLAIFPLSERHADLPVREFGPLLLKAHRDWMIDQKTPAGLVPTRGVVNERIRIIRSVFEWGVSEQLVPVGIWQALKSVKGLPAGRSRARETKGVAAVSDAAIEATLTRLPTIVADMVRFQRLTGCRPGEVCQVRPCDVERFDRDGEALPLFAGEPAPARKLDVWRYRPARHKTEHHGKERVIMIGPKAQAVLLPYLARPAESFCFSPAESETLQRQQRHARRTTPLSSGNRPRPSIDRTFAPCYDKDTYAKAIKRACDAAFPPPDEWTATKEARAEHAAEIKAWRKARRWAPNQLRHTAGTAIRKAHGAEQSRVVLGHSKLSTTEIYAERDLAEAASIMRKMG